MTELSLLLLLLLLLLSLLPMLPTRPSSCLVLLFSVSLSSFASAEPHTGPLIFFLPERTRPHQANVAVCLWSVPRSFSSIHQRSSIHPWCRHPIRWRRNVGLPFLVLFVREETFRTAHTSRPIRPIHAENNQQRTKNLRAKPVPVLMTLHTSQRKHNTETGMNQRSENRQ